MSADLEAEILAVNQRLLHAIISGDWEVYCDLCDSSLTAFEPEAAGHLVEGLPFHHFYFQLERAPGPRYVTMSSPKVRLLGDVAVLTYVRLNQSLVDNQPVTSAVEETRVWHRQGGKWKHVHFHRSPIG